jgi:hypothetical protein
MIVQAQYKARAAPCKEKKANCLISLVGLMGSILKNQFNVISFIPQFEIRNRIRTYLKNSG